MDIAMNILWIFGAGMTRNWRPQQAQDQSRPGAIQIQRRESA
jgi:hypothetical protein